MAADSSQAKPGALTRQLTSHLDPYLDDQDADDLDEARHSHSAAHAEVPGSPPDRERAGMRFLVASATDIGGGTVNQDKFDVFRAGPNEEHLVMAVYDGHGRELGELAAEVARDRLRELLRREGAMERVSEDAQTFFSEAFRAAHIAIKERFRKKYERAGWEVRETEEHYLIKRRGGGGNWTCTHGGTTATVVVVLAGSHRAIVANVGDSTALWGARKRSSSSSSSGSGRHEGAASAEISYEFEELSAEHSPESESEFKRVRAFKADASGRMPDMRFVFDSPSFQKAQCPPVFRVSSSDPGEITNTGMGNYYKNVRNEWASLCTTPPHARFQDALAFTRSLGDLHLHVYGVTWEPEVKEFDLAEAHAARAAAVGPGGAVVSCLLVCTDGVWDNWRYPDVVAEALRPERVAQALESGSAAQATSQLMASNMQLAREHFGNQADNMTAILCYVLADD